MPGQHGKGDGNETVSGCGIMSTAGQFRSQAYVAWKGEDKVTRGKSGGIWVDQNIKASCRTKNVPSTPRSSHKSCLSGQF